LYPNLGYQGRLFQAGVCAEQTEAPRELALIEMAHARRLPCFRRGSATAWQARTHASRTIIRAAMEHGASAILLAWVAVRLTTWPRRIDGARTRISTTPAPAQNKKPPTSLARELGTHRED